jgi:Protein of unknown function (DUF4229)
MNDPDTWADSVSAANESEFPAQGDATDPDPANTELTPAEPVAPSPVPHAGARYALLRLLMLVAVGGILYVIGMRGWLLAFAAVLVSGLVSLFLLMKQRNDAAVNLEHTVESWKHRHDHEDAGLTQE